jgi:hypothetical protein
VAGCCECGDEPSGSCATELVSLVSYVHLLYVVQSKNSWTCPRHIQSFAAHCSGCSR